MSEFALVKLSDSSVLERQIIALEKLPSVKNGFVWLPVVYDSEPTVDLLREKFVSSFNITPTEARVTYQVVALSKERRKENVDAKYDELLGTVVPEELEISTITRVIKLLLIKIRHLEDSNSPDLSAAEAMEFAQIEAVGVWQDALLTHAATLKTQIDADQDPLIASGWPTFSP